MGKMKKTILIPDRLKPPADIEQSVFGDDAKILTPCAKHSSEIDDMTWSKIDAILAWHELQYTSDIISKLDRCKAIIRIGVGFDNVDLKAAGDKGILVCNVPDYCTNDVADHTVGLMLDLARGIHLYSESVRDSMSWDWNIAQELHRLTGATMGIIGLGRIGTATALRAKAFGMNIVFYDPYIHDGYDKVLGVERCEKIYDLLNRSDVVSIHTPLTEETVEMADYTFFKRIKKGAIFINSARGNIVNIDALTEALQTNQIIGAGLDVLPQEPPDPKHPLIRAWRNRESWISGRLIITPHSAFYNKESYEEMRKKAAEETVRNFNGLSPRNCVNYSSLR